MVPDDTHEDQALRADAQQAPDPDRVLERDELVAGGLDDRGAPGHVLAMMSQILRRALSKETCSECGATYYRPLAVPDLMCPDCGERYRVVLQNERGSAPAGSRSGDAEDPADREL